MLSFSVISVKAGHYLSPGGGAGAGGVWGDHLIFLGERKRGSVSQSKGGITKNLKGFRGGSLKI